MNASTRIWCVVPAAGVGKRFGSAMPKQYLQLNGKTVVENTLERLLSLSEISQVVVGVGMLRVDLDRPAEVLLGAIMVCLVRFECCVNE